MKLQGRTLQVGDWVRVVADPWARGPRRARVLHFYDHIQGGLRLDRPIFGFVSWHVLDVRRARAIRSEPSELTWHMS